MTAGEFFSLLKTTWKEFNEDEAPRLGAALAYYTALSLAPLLILMIALAGLVFGDEAARGQLFEQIDGMVGTDGAKAIQEMVQNASKPASGIIASIIGFLTLLFGASSVAGELKAALNVIWDQNPDPNAGIADTVKQRSSALVVVLGCGFLLLVSLAVSSVLAAGGKFLGGFLPLPEIVLQAINIIVSVIVITGVFAGLFKFLPDVDVQWRDVLLGAAFTAILFTIGKFLIGLYLGKASFGSTYGAAGSLVIVLVWVYYSAQIFFFGAEFTQVYAGAHGSDPAHKRKEPASRKAAPSTPQRNAARKTPKAAASARPAPAQARSGGVLGTLLGSVLAATKIARVFRK